MVDRHADGIAKRLAQAIPEEGIRAFAREMEDREVRGSSYAMIHRYLAGKKVPSLEFVEEAASVLGVRPAWLAYDDGEPTEPEERISDVLLGDGDEWYRDNILSTAPSILLLGGSAALGPLDHLLRKLLAADPSEGEPSEDDVAAVAGAVQELLVRPLYLFRGRPLAVEEELADYIFAALSALALAVPGRGQGRPITELVEEHEEADDE